MSCVTSIAIAIDCADSIGGVDEIYVLEKAAITAYTESSGVITGITRTASKKFNRYELRDEVGEMTFPINYNEQNGTNFYEHTVDFALSALTTTKRNELKIVAVAKVVVIVKDSNGVYWLCGRTKGMYPSGGTPGVGKAKGDLNGWQMTLIAREVEPPIEVDSTYVDSSLVNGL